MKFNKLVIAFFFLSTLVTIGCKEEDNIDSSLRIAFQEFNGTLASADNVSTINILASKPVDSEVNINIGVSSSCASLAGNFVFKNANGELIDLAGGIALNTIIPVGSTSTVITVEAAEGKFPVGTQSITLDLLAVENAKLNDSHLSFELLVGAGAGFFPNTYTNGFENCVNSIPTDFSLFFAEGSKSDRTWFCRAEGNGSTNAVVANAFGGEAGTTDAWLVTKKKLDFSNTATATISLDAKSEFTGNGTIEFLWSSEYCGAGSPIASEWINLTALEAQLPAKGSNVYTTLSANIASLIGESGYFAIRFLGASNDNSTAYTFDNFKLGATASGGGGGSGTTGSSFSTDFEGCTEDFATPANFIEVFLTAKEDRGWGCRSFGLDGSRAVQASAFGGAEGEENSWLIIDQAFDFTGLNTVNFQFQMFSNFEGPGQVIVQYSTDYSGSGTPTAATWTSLSAINSAMPAAGTKVWTPINEDIPGLGNKTVYIAFQFVGANSTASSSWAIDNLAINDSEAFSGTGGGTGGGDPTDQVTIADAKTQIGATVTVTGIVTTPDYGFNNGQYFIQDATAGVNIYHAGNFGLVNVGDEVTITGEVGEFNGLKQIAPGTINVVSTGNSLPVTAKITTADLVATSPLMASYVEISGVTLVDASQWPTESIAAGSGLNVNATVNGTNFIIRIDRGESFYDGSTAPTGSFTLKGILGRFNDEVQILPFLEGDVQ